MNGDPRYCIMDPTGNVTALVISPVRGVFLQERAADIMARHPEVEQVGAVQFPRPWMEVPLFNRIDDGYKQVNAYLYMAAGEFCGNASLCAAALCALRTGRRITGPVSVLLSVSGAEDPVEVILERENDVSFRGKIHMPPALAIEEKAFDHGGISAPLPVVRMEGISHAIIEPDSPFSKLRERPEEAEAAVRAFCGELGADGLGLIFLGDKSLTPLVYVPGSGTVFWEHSCASGTAAAGMYLAAKTGRKADLTFEEPGGTLRVTSTPVRRNTWLYGRTRLVAAYY